MKLPSPFPTILQMAHLTFIPLVGLTTVISATPSDISLSNSSIQRESGIGTVIGQLSINGKTGEPISYDSHPHDLTADLRAFFPFNGDATDQSGNGYNAKVFGATLTEDRFGNPDSAYHFGGRRSYILVPPVGGMSDPYTLLLFYKTSAGGLALSSTPIDKPPTEKWGDRRIYVDGKFRVNGGVYDNGVKHIQSSTAFDKNQWHSVALMQVAGVIQMFMDGKEVAKRKAYSVSTKRSERWSIGYANMVNDWPNRPPNHSFRGQIDDFYIYSRALSIIELQYIHNYKSTPNFRKTSFSLPKGEDNELFQIDEDRLKLKQALDFSTKNKYTVLVSATTTKGISLTQTFSIQEQIEKNLSHTTEDPINISNQRSFIITDIGINMIKVEEGEFLMGSPATETGRFSDETQHIVRITKPFWLGKFEVTQGQWNLLMGSNPSYFKGAGNDAPVEKVSWEDAMSYCKKINELEKKSGRLPQGFQYTLPTEAQWEYACRAGSSTALYSGSLIILGQNNAPQIDSIGWYGGNSEANYDGAYKIPSDWKETQYSFSHAGPQPVGLKISNAFGFYDMIGNVSEWCLDWHGQYPTQPEDDPTGSISGTKRIIRGAGYNQNAVYCRAASRLKRTPGERSSSIGFRLALSSILKSKHSSENTTQQSSQLDKPARAESPKIGVDWQIPEIGIEMVSIAPGTFIMGSPQSEHERRPDETQFEVTLTHHFWVGKYEVTQKQWQKIMGHNPSHFKGDQHPVDQVSWEDAMEFCKKLSIKDKAKLPLGYHYRLPTEAQWEYVCRAGTTTVTSFGDSFSSRDANVKGHMPYGGARPGPFLRRTTKVGQYEPNNWGIYDMHGNVYEWCFDFYGKYPSGKAVNPSGPSTGGSHVFRGGGWDSSGFNCRSAVRKDGMLSQGNSNQIGFRIVLNPIHESVNVPGDITPVSSQFDNPARTASPEIDKDWKIPEIGIEMVSIAPGEFLMGSPESEHGREDDETLHKVTISKPFWIGKYEVTQSQWTSLMPSNPSKFRGMNLPVEKVNWRDAQEYCRKLNIREEKAKRLPEGYQYSLPTEAQWEYACRSGNQTPVAFGVSLSSKQANFDGNKPYQKASLGPYLQRTTLVGSYPPNPWGLHDMHGNVREWCQDWYGAYSGESVIDPLGAKSGTERVIRGGYWSGDGIATRSANRDSTRETSKGSSLGFRVCLSPIIKLPAPINLADAKHTPTLENPKDFEVKEFRNLSVKLTMIKIDPGEFEMGSLTSEDGRNIDEVHHNVKISSTYWLGKHEVSQGHWKKLFGTNPSWFKGERLPVENISWEEANEFCKNLTTRERESGRIPPGYHYCLPTEAQWEFACRAARKGATSFGNNLSSEKANFMGKVPYGKASIGDHLERTTEVGKYEPNAWGFHDLHGNVWEWCSNWYAPYPIQSITDATNPGSRLYKVRRGGSWKDVGKYCRSAYRSRFEPDRKSSSTGFRLCLAPVRK